jgi:hypothetical protein
MNDTPRTPTETVETMQPAPASPAGQPTVAKIEAGDSEAVESPIVPEKRSAAPAPLKI